MKAFEMTFERDKDLNTNAAILAKVLRGEFAGGCGNFIGYRFIYSEGEHSTHKRAGQNKFAIDCSEMMRNAREQNAKLRIFRNLNGELACMLIEGVMRGHK